MKSVQKISETTQDRILEMDLSAELKHGVVVSNLAYDVAKELGLGEKECYQLAIAGMLHDIGKLKLEGYINGQEQNPMVIEELKYVRMHSTLGYEILKDQGYSDYVLESILYHHENFDGSGYPCNRSGKDIPMGARILRVCDVYAALSMDRPYRKALENDEVLRLMIDEIKNFDMQVFLASSLRTVSSPYISHLKCLKRSWKLVCIIGIISGKRYGQVIAKSGICQIILCFCSIQFQFLASLHDLEDQFFIFTALLAAEILNMFYTGSLNCGKTKGSVRLSDHIHHIVTDCHFLR